MVHLPHPPSLATAHLDSYQDRRQFLSTAAMGIVSASAASLLSTHPAPAAENAAIRPFHIDVPKEGLVNLRERVMMTRWPDRETVADPSQGVQLATMQELARYWATEHDWRKVEARLNALPQFITEIDGLDIHFIHVRSKHDNALPMIVTHGWPGSIIEQLKISRTADQSHGAWRQCIGRFPSGDPLATGPWLFGEADGAGVDPRQHCSCVGDVDATARLHTLRGAGRGLGECRLGGDGAAAAAGIARHSHQHGGHSPSRCFKGSFDGRAAACRALG